MVKKQYIYIGLAIIIISVILISKQKMRLPVRNAKLTSGYGNRKHPITGKTTLHNGIDLAAPIGTPILSPVFGVIEDVNYTASGGNQVFVKHLFGGFKSGYAHLNKSHVKKGQFVVPGQHMADVGNTGQSTGPHLHLSLRKNGELVDPEKYFRM